MKQTESVDRTNNIKFHIGITFIYKFFAILLSFLLIPLTIGLLSVEKYGVWMTIVSVFSWISFFDIGISNGLRNKLTEALAINDIKLAKTYVSSAFIVICFISFLLFLGFLFFLKKIQWNIVFNIKDISNSEFSYLLLYVGFFFLLNFILSLSKQLFYAYQEASLATLGQLFLNVFALIGVYLLVFFKKKSLLYLSISYGLSTVLSNLILIIYFFYRHRNIIPSLLFFNLGKIKEISTLGIKFFIIQIAAIIIFTTDNIIITQILGPKEVTTYNIAFKLFSFVSIIHGIIIAPLWSGYTDAYAKGDILWIKKILRKMNLLMIPIILITLILTIFAKDIINIWIGPSIRVSQLLLLCMGVYMTISAWSNTYAYCINGIGKVNIQMATATIAGLINIPLSIYFAKECSLGVTGVVIGTICSLMIFAVIGPIQIHYFFKKSNYD